MRKMPVLMFACILFFSTLGCEEAPKEPHTVEWWKAHPKERKELLMICNTNAAALKKNDLANCPNAQKAEMREGLGELNWGASTPPTSPVPAQTPASK